MKLFIGFILGILFVVVVAGVIIYSGMINMAASAPPSFLEEVIGHELFEKSLERRAGKQQNPYSGNETALEEGLNEYKEMCVVCHGIQGVEPGEIGEGLSPAPPYLDIAEVQEKTDGEIFWILKHGIKMTGMPAFGKTHSDEELWKVVAFVKTLPNLSEDQKQELKSEGEEQEQHEH